MRDGLLGQGVVVFGLAGVLGGVNPMSRSKGDCLVVLDGQELWVYWASGSH